jgi:hemerythrin
MVFAGRLEEMFLRPVGEHGGGQGGRGAVVAKEGGTPRRGLSFEGEQLELGVQGTDITIPIGPRRPDRLLFHVLEPDPRPAAAHPIDPGAPGGRTAPDKRLNRMTKLLIWRDEWSLGIDALDADHRALVGTLIDISLRFCPQAALPPDLPGDARAPVTPVSTAAASADLIAGLVAFGVKVQAHFRREEAFMRAIRYAQTEQHATEHVVLMTQFDAMLSDWRGRAITVR